MNEILRLPRSSLISTIATKTKSKIFSVTFIKKDGSIRRMVCRFGVTSKLKGGKTTLDEKKFFIVYDMEKHEYRAVNKETIISAKIRGINYEVNDTWLKRS